ncbi:MAG: hypothetical protein ACOYNC_05500 [Bacteroidales bacterium]
MRSTILLRSVALMALFSLLLQNSFAQKNILTGFVITLQGDTMHGYIDYRNWEKNPGMVFFRNDREGPAREYKPLEIKAFGVLDEIYESAIVKTEESSVETTELTYSNELQFRNDTTFLQGLIKGEKCLYFYRSKTGKDQFYIRTDSSYELLVYKKYLKDQDGHTLITENKRFIGQLTIYLSSCNSLQEKLNKTEYRKNSLENLFLAYYRCTRSELTFQKKTEKTQVQIGVLAGVSLTSLKFSGTDYYHVLTEPPFSKSVNFAGGVFFDVILPRNLGKWSICNELLFTSYQTSARFEEYTSKDKYSILNITFGYSYLKMNNMVRFKYPVGKTSLFLNAGVSSGFAVYEKNYVKLETKLFDQVRVQEDKVLNDTRRYEIGFVAGIGIKYWRLSMETRYETSNGMSDYADLKSSVNRFYLLFGYRF